MKSLIKCQSPTVHIGRKKKKTVTISTEVDYLGDASKPPLNPAITPTQVLMGSPVATKRRLVLPEVDEDVNQIEGNDSQENDPMVPLEEMIIEEEVFASN